MIFLCVFLIVSMLYYFTGGLCWRGCGVDIVQASNGAFFCGLLLYTLINFSDILSIVVVHTLLALGFS